MALETGTFIDDLVATNPVSATDLVRYGASHIRLLKDTIKNSFAGAGGAILVAAADGSATANTITLTPTPALTEYTTRMLVVWLQAVTNTGATTINISSLGAKSVVSVANASLVSGDLVAGRVYVGIYDGTNVQLLAVTKNYVDQLAFNTALPAQVADYFLTSNGSVASFGNLLKTGAMRFADSSDTTKRIGFDASSVTSGATRIITMPDYDVNLSDVYSKPRMASGRYYTYPFALTLSGATVTVNRLYGVPIFISEKITFTKIGVNVTSAAGNARLGIYNINNDALPSTLVLDAGAIALSGTGEKEITISQSLTPGWYYVAAVFDNGSTQVSQFATTGAGSFVLGGGAATSVGTAFAPYVALTYGALPDPFGTATLADMTTAHPLIWLRY